MQNGVAVVGGGSDVEEGQLVRTFVVVAFGDIDGIARIAQTKEVYAFDDAAVFNVETGMMRFASAISNAFPNLGMRSSESGHSRLR